VRNTTLATVTARRIRWASVGLVLGLVVMLVFFTRNSFVALAGFLVMVVAAGWIVSSLRTRNSESLTGVVDRVRRRWRRDG
jgi:ABC-type iron transport system FetAB permease component